MQEMSNNYILAIKYNQARADGFQGYRLHLIENTTASPDEACAYFQGVLQGDVPALQGTMHMRDYGADTLEQIGEALRSPGITLVAALEGVPTASCLVFSAENLAIACNDEVVED